MRMAHDVNRVGRLTMDREETTEEKKSRLFRTAGRRKSKVTGTSKRRESKVIGKSAVESRESQGSRSVRLRLLNAILVLLSVMLFSGCVRIAAELDCKPTDCYAEDRIYMGIERSSKGYYIIGDGAELIVLFSFPFEFIADTVLLPFDLALTVLYNLDKPLNELIREKEKSLKALKRRLDKGEDPNFIDTRYKAPYRDNKNRRNPGPPILEAVKQSNMEAFIALLDHGAEVPLEIFHDMARYNWYEYGRAVLARGFPREVTESYAAQNIVSHEIWKAFHDNDSVSDDEFEYAYSTVKLFLEKGFPPNAKESISIYYDNESCTFKYRRNANSLDIVQKHKGLSQEQKEKFVNLLRKHGAKSSSELDTIQLPSKIDVEGIPEMFKPAADIFLKSNRKSYYRFSTSYPGVDGPVLVVDGGRECCFNEERWKMTMIYRTMTYVHHRETPTRWSQTGIPFEIPIDFRVVLTPKGVRIPSRIHGDMPTKGVIQEEWLTLPTCEAYIEWVPGIRSEYETVDLAKLEELAGKQGESSPWKDTHHFPYRVDNNPLGRSVPEYYPLARFFIDTKSEHDYSYDVKRIREANELTRAAGIKGNWYLHGFSSHRNLKYLSAAQDHIVPYPDEFLVIDWSAHASSLFSPNIEEAPHDYREEQKGQYYWNSRAYKLIGGERGAFVYVLYGDEVSPEQFEPVLEIYKKAFLK